MTEEEAMDYLWAGKSAYLRDEGERGPLRPNPAFGQMLYATLVVNATMRIWNGKHPVESNTVERTAPPGTPVLVTMVSRFGDVGIRDDKLTPPTDGYYCRVQPDELTDWRLAP